jgi:hypothetical protein
VDARNGRVVHDDVVVGRAAERQPVALEQQDSALTAIPPVEVSAHPALPLVARTIRETVPGSPKQDTVESDRFSLLRRPKVCRPRHDQRPRSRRIVDAVPRRQP